MVKNRGLCFFKAKNAKKVKINPSSQNFTGPPYDPKINIIVLNCSCNCYIFSTYGDFSNTIPKKSYGESNKCRAILAPPLRAAGVN